MVDTPAAWRLARRSRPNASCPRQPCISTRAPARAAATAWLAPLPPGNCANLPPETVSPGAGRRSTYTTRSVLMLPKTYTRPSMRRSAAAVTLARAVAGTWRTQARGRAMTVLARRATCYDPSTHERHRARESIRPEELRGPDPPVLDGQPALRPPAQRRRQDVRHRHPAAERHGRPAHGPRPEQLAAGHRGALPPDARRRDALGAGLRPRGHRHPARRGEGAEEARHGTARDRPGEVRRGDLEGHPRAPRHHREPAQAARLLLRLGARALHARRGPLRAPCARSSCRCTRRASSTGATTSSTGAPRAARPSPTTRSSTRSGTGRCTATATRSPTGPARSPSPPPGPRPCSATPAVAVHPDDPRYKHLVGKTLVLPLVGPEDPHHRRSRGRPGLRHGRREGDPGPRPRGLRDRPPARPRDHQHPHPGREAERQRARALPGPDRGQGAGEGGRGPRGGRPVRAAKRTTCTRSATATAATP